MEVALLNFLRETAWLPIVGLGLSIIFQGLARIGNKNTRDAGAFLLADGIIIIIIIFLAPNPTLNTEWWKTTPKAIAIMGIGFNILSQVWLWDDKRIRNKIILGFGLLLGLFGEFLIFICSSWASTCSITIVLLTAIIIVLSLYLIKLKWSAKLRPPTT
jgi:hypothetical protein